MPVPLFLCRTKPTDYGFTMKAFLSKRRTLVVVVLALVIVLAATLTVRRLRRETVEVYEIHRARSAIMIDGAIDPAEWAHASKATPEGPAKAAEPTIIHITFDEDWLDVGITCLDSSVAAHTEDWRKTDSLFMRISVGEVATPQRHDFTFCLTPHKTVSARFRSGPRAAMREFIDDSKPLPEELYRMAAKTLKKGWSMELALSWQAVKHPTGGPKGPLSLFVERRNINGDRIQVSDWPYYHRVRFVLVSQ